MQRSFDIVLFGATGYTGELVAEYLHSHAPAGARLAIAGRGAAKLEALRDRLGAAGMGVLLADATEPGSLAELAASTRVVVSTVGPYLLHGEPLVAACAAAGTDYVDLAGEPEFVDLMYLRHHASARDSGARLVHSCGFDSIPYDLGALFTVSRLPAGVPIALQGFGLARGAISGGTLHSAVNAIARFQEAGRISRQRRAIERYAPDGAIAEGRTVRGAGRRPHKEPLAGGWVAPAPTIDPDHVLRSARLDPAYGPDFTYAHYIVTRRLSRTIAAAAGLGVVVTMAQFEPTKRLILRLRPRGSGPSAERRARSFFRVRFVADYGYPDHRGRLITQVRGGDPGYGETAKMLAESAFALAFDSNLPNRGGGQWTPALALGWPLIERLERAGIVFEVVGPTL